MFEKWSLFLMRVGLGWMMLYAGLTKILNPEWTAAGYLANAKTWSGLFNWFASPANIGWINFVNEWGLTILGISLVLGIGVRLSGILGAILMMLYYFPILDFPYPNAHNYIVDEHIIYALALLWLSASRAGRTWGLEKWCAGLPICSRYPKLRALVG